MKQLSLTRVIFTLAAIASSLSSGRAQLEVKKIGVPSTTKPAGAPTMQLPATMTGLTPIYKSFGEVYAEYDPSEGYVIAGTSAAMREQMIGMPFTPVTDSTIYVIDAAVQYVSGTNSVSYAVYTDDAGLPGTSIASFTAGNLANYENSCCDSRVVVSTAGVPVKANTQYWIVLSAPTAAPDFYGNWSFNYTLTNGSLAYNPGSGWILDSDPIGAYGVYGLAASN